MDFRTVPKTSSGIEWDCAVPCQVVLRRTVSGRTESSRTDSSETEADYFRTGSRVAWRAIAGQSLRRKVGSAAAIGRLLRAGGGGGPWG